MIIVSRPCWPGLKLPKKCRVVHNGTVIFDVDMSGKSGITSEVRLGFVGRIHPAKGLHLLLDWMAVALKKDIKFNLSLSIRGSFSEDAPQYESKIKNKIKNLGLSSQVEFLGFVDDPDQIYDGLDILIVPSKTPDPLPRSVMESMARGIPVFGYPAGGISEMIDDKKSGFLVKNEDEFLEAINFLVDSPDAFSLMSKQAREKIENEFTLGVMYKSLQNIYNV